MVNGVKKKCFQNDQTPLILEFYFHVYFRGMKTHFLAQKMGRKSDL